MIELYLTGDKDISLTLGRAAAAVLPSGGLGRAVVYTANELRRYAASITHVDTGTLAGSHRLTLLGDASARVAPGEDRNPKSGQPASRYAPYEHARGGGHAFYERTLDEAGRRIAEEAVKSQIVGGLE